MARGKKGSINNIWAHCFYLLGFLEGKSRGKEGKEQAGSYKAVLNATNGLLLQLHSPGSNDVSQVPDCGGRDGSAARGQLTTITGQWDPAWACHSGSKGISTHLHTLTSVCKYTSQTILLKKKSNVSLQLFCTWKLSQINLKRKYHLKCSMHMWWILDCQNLTTWEIN